jgi:hypothetical protein
VARIVPPFMVIEDPLEVAKRPLATEPLVATQFEVPLIVTVPLLLDVPVRRPALTPYLPALSGLEAFPVVVMLTVPTVRLPEL